MISNQILQDTIDGIKAITRIDLCVMDTEGKPLASTLDAVEEYKEAVLVFAESLAESQALQGYQFFKVFDENQLEYIILVKGETDDVYMVGKMAAFQVQNLLIAYKERFDKDNFIKNLLLDNLLLVDIYNRAKKLHIETDVRRCVFIVETKNDRDNNAFETVRNIFSAKTRDFITAVDEKNIILVKEVKNGEGYDELTKTAQVIVDMLNTEAMTKVHVAFGTIVNEIKEVSRSYKEAKMAMDVGKIFYPDKNVIAYSRLGIGRLIYQLPLPLCKMFIKEIFDGRSPDEFDEDFGSGYTHYAANPALGKSYAEYIRNNAVLGNPLTDSEGQTIDTEENNRRISPRLMLASQHGVTTADSYTNSRDKCAAYVENDATTNERYSDWRMPTLAEVYLIDVLQNIKVAEVKKILEGSWYWSARASSAVQFMDPRVGNTNSFNALHSSVRCVRDVKF